ncbi:MAG: relaxase/mobilization nuclease domain-containing protein [Lachnospiraceae bacterium]|nr:relaxase/mobilization nuclease domain-containing protein [Lachnospiraceae bacterium]
MPIIKHISIHSTPLSNIEYILNGDKNDEMKFATGLNCTANPQSAYDEFRRTFEYYAKERFFKSDLNFQNDEKKKSKEKVRIHHYVQSFDPKENVTPDEAHKIGIEWAKKTFGENMQVIVSTHLDKGHIHNHFAVCPYTLEGKRWIDNMNTLNRARKISDEIALEHGLHIIENPKHKNTMKYSEWLAKQNGTSWKQQLAAEIDKLVLREDVQSVEDLADKLKEQGYTVRSGKYLSVKAPKQKNAIRSYRLGDGYSVDDLQYRILHKEQEISLTAIQRYSGVQREYAFCMRQMQIAVFTKKPKRATYSDLQKSAELLNYLSSNNITSASELESRLNAAAENYQNFILKKKELSSQIDKVEKIIADGKRYLDLVDKDFLTADEKEEYKKVSYIEKMSIGSFVDIEQRQQNVDSLKKELAELDVTIEKQKEERDYISGLFRTYKRDIENNPYEEIQRQLEADQQEQQAEQERQEEYQKGKER